MSAATLPPRCDCGRILTDGRCVEHSGETYCQPCDRWITSHQYRRHLKSTAHIINVRGPITGGAVDDGATPRTHEENVAWLNAFLRRERTYGPLLAACKTARHAFDCDGFGRGNRSCKTCDAAEDQLNDAIALAEGGA